MLPHLKSNVMLVSNHLTAWCSNAENHKFWSKVLLLDARLEVFTAIKIQIAVSWVVTLHAGVVGYQHFGGLCCLHLQDEVNGAM